MTARWVDGLAGLLARRTSRRGLLARTAVVGAAVALDPVNYVLRPASAYSSVCGEGATCASGWTAFCVTINNGVNQCPPGSFAAGWWKADHAGVCGGHARYYIDCNATCVPGRPGHYGCSCRCAHTSTCDKRHTCCNHFRYGQCNTGTHCYGPVVCRVVSCVPPWKWAPCSRSAATDNATLSHSAPALPHHWDAIERRYSALRGHASPLGASVGGRLTVPGGLVQGYEHGHLVWSPKTPAAMLVATSAAYRHFGGPRGMLGFPTVDERRTHDGQAYLMTGTGGTLWVAGTDAFHCEDGAWLSRWVALVDDTSIAGRPLSHLLTCADGQGRRADFANGTLMFAPWTGAFALTGAAASAYAAMGRETSVLEYPTADTVATAYGSVTTFQNGLMYATGGGTFTVVSPILGVYQQNGAEAGAYGLPTADAVTAGSQTSQTFERGTITVDNGSA